MLLTTLYPEFAAKYICAVGLLICFAQYTWARPPSRTPVDVNIVAHQDDDILFMNPDILNAVVAGHRQVTVYITAGNVGVGPGDEHAYAVGRENGAIAGYQKLLELADTIRTQPRYFNDFTGTFEGDSRVPDGDCPSPSPSPASAPDPCFPCTEHNSELTMAGTASVHYPDPPLHIGSRDLPVVDIGDAPGGGPWVRLIFLRVTSGCTVDNSPPPLDPNCNCPSCDQPLVNLGQLFISGDSNLQIGSVFTQDGYTKQQLINQLVDILRFVQPDVVRTQDTADGIDVDDPGAYRIPNMGCPYAPEYLNPQFYDHSDHVWGARFARQAVGRYDNLPNSQNQPTYFTYKGYNLEWNEAPRTRVSTKDFCLKKSIIFHYALYDTRIIGGGEPQPSLFDCDFSYWYIGYQKRQQQQSP